MMIYTFALCTSLFDGLPRFLGPSLVAAALPEPGAPLAAGVAWTFLAGWSSPSVVAFRLASCTSFGGAPH